MSWLIDLALGALPNFWPWLVGALGGVGLYVMGRINGGSKAKRKQAEARVKTMEKAEEVEDAVDAKTDTAVRGDLGRWVRPD